jgi:hypothetical protein
MVKIHWTFSFWDVMAGVRYVKSYLIGREKSYLAVIKRNNVFKELEANIMQDYS